MNQSRQNNDGQDLNIEELSSAVLPLNELKAVTPIVSLVVSKDLPDVYSDCGTNLKGTTSKLNMEIQRINEYSSNEQFLGIPIHPLLYMCEKYGKDKNTQKRHVRHNQKQF